MRFSLSLTFPMIQSSIYGSCKVSENNFFGADETGLKKIKTVIRKLSKTSCFYHAFICVHLRQKPCFGFKYKPVKFLTTLQEP
jgi:hypothetical protein